MNIVAEFDNLLTLLVTGGYLPEITSIAIAMLKLVVAYSVPIVLVIGFGRHIEPALRRKHVRETARVVTKRKK